MGISQNGVNLIKFFEGFRRKAYQDTAGIWTIGYGHTKNVSPDMIITETKGEELLREDLVASANRFNRVVNVEYSQNEYDALMSQAFNLRSFEKLARYFNQDKNLWKTKTLLYCKDIKGNFLKGLKVRRISERLVSEGRDWKDFALWAQGKQVSIEDVLIIEYELFK